ncbi:MAG: thioredoxin [Pseudomonadota bacterium]
MQVIQYDPHAGQNFADIIGASNTIVDFYADWCGPCQAMTPTLNAFAEKHTDVQVLKVNIDKHPELASQYGVRSIPTLLGFTGGEENGRTVGVTNQEGMAALLA